MKNHKMLLKMTGVVVASTLVLSGCSSESGNEAKSGDGKSATKSADGKESKDGSEENLTIDNFPDYEFAETAWEDVKQGGEVRTGIYEIPEQQNPHHADGSATTSTIWYWYNPQIALFDGEGNFTANPDYITDVKEETIDGNTRVTYTIRDEAKWNDGTDMDWTAFEATWKINNGKDDAFTPNSTDGYELISSVEPGDTPKQAVINFDGAWPWWQGLFNNLAHPALADPANYNDYVKKVHPEWGAGPYKVDYIDFNKGEAVFVPNENWWGPKGRLDKRIFIQMKDQAAVNAFKNGEIDALSIGNKERYASIKDMPGIDVRLGREAANNIIMLNSKAPQLEDIAVRKAIFQAIDREQLAQIRFQGLPYTETPPGSLILYPWQEGYEDNFGSVVQFSTEEARKTLEDAGYTEGADGIYEKDGTPIQIRYTLTGEDEIGKAQAIATQKMLENAGIKLEIENRPSSEFSNIFTERDFELFPMAFKSSDPFGVAYFGQTYKSDSGLNLSATGTPEMDAKIEELQKLSSADEQLKRSNELEKEAFEHYGLMPTGNRPVFAAVKKGLVNMGAYNFAVVPVENVGWSKDSE